MSFALRRVARAIRHTPDRLLHPFRRRVAYNTVRRLPRSPLRVLVVCHGNICRSPYAAARLRRSVACEGLDDSYITSAGFIGPGRPPPDAALTVAKNRGLDLSNHRSEVLAPAVVSQAELILVMDTVQRLAMARRFRRTGRDVALLGDFDPQKLDMRTIRDPIEQPITVFEECYDRIDRCIDALFRVVVEVNGRDNASQ